ncbi:MAG TPA: pitrilysin family protein, partial [Bryobacteraceae bacterium]
MRKPRILSCFAIAMVLAAGAVRAQQPAAPAKSGPPAAAKTRPQGTRAAGYKSLKFPPLHNVKVPEPTRYELPNGMAVYLVEDHELPLISASAIVRAGSRWEPAGKTGLASITGSVMRTGGTNSRPGDQLDLELDRLGASVETGIGQDSGRASVSVLKEDFDKGLDILADILQHPAFPQDKIELAKIAQRDQIARRNDNPNGIIFREFGRVLFGKDSPYARITEYDTINSITRDDLVAFHRRFFQPENVILGVWGDFDAAGVRGKIEEALGSWQRGGQPKPEVPAVDPAARERTGIYSINKPDMSQSWVLMGMLGGKRSDPDYAPLEVMNEILGGGLASRLFSHVRTDQGLAYAVFSAWQPAWDRPGIFAAGGSSKPATTMKLYKSIRHELETIASGGVTADELARAKDGLLKSSAFDFDSTGKIVERLMTYEYFGYPKDFLQQHRVQLDAVSSADVARVARQYIKPEGFSLIVLGNEKAYDAPLSSLGKVTELDYSIPQPAKKAAAAATPESEAKGKALLAAAREAMGGAALLAVKDLTTKGEMNLDTPQGPMSMKLEVSVDLSGKLLNTMQTPMGEMAMGFDGRSGWMRMGPNIRDLPDAQKDEAQSSLFRASIALLQNYDKPGYKVQALDPEELDGKKYDVVAVTGPARNLQATVFLDPATHMIAAKHFLAALMGPPTDTEEL